MSTTLTVRSDHGIQDLLLYVNPDSQFFTASVHNLATCSIGRWRNTGDGKNQCRTIDILTDNDVMVTFRMFRKRPVK